MVLDYL